jgi:hypothetical protein
MLRLIITKMKRNKKSIQNKKTKYDDFDKFDRKKLRNGKRERNTFSNQYEHELYLDNIDYYDELNTIEDFQTP